MPHIRTVTLEFVRRGPAHNQLLSPLTDYLGLCGSYGAATVQVPYEHQTFLRRLKELRYQQSDQRDTAGRQGTINETAEEITKILAAVPGLLAGLNWTEDDSHTLIHLNFVISASELALLPFELAKVPPGGAGGEGNWLLLQTLAPVCLTRQVRSVSNDNLSWPRKPKILFIAASPGEMQVPLEQHTLALLKAIQPWLPPFDPQKPRDLEQQAGKILTILPHATMEEIQKKCSEESFTHVHVLAHGMEETNLPGSPFGLALHSRFGKDGIEVVSGSRFATALRPLRSDIKREGAASTNRGLPAVVTVASCDSGSVNSVLYNNGASFAHELHQAGIPFVVASQFPLSFPGSIHMAEVLYTDLLWGEDPRTLLHKLRGKLYSLQGPDTHDWASLVVYAALPNDLEAQLKDAGYTQARNTIDTAMAHIDTVVDTMEDDRADTAAQSDRANSDTPDDTIQKIQKYVDAVDEAVRHMPTTGEYETEGTGMRASAEKRKAEAWYRLSCHIQGRERQEECRRQCIDGLRQSLHYYEQASQENMRETGDMVLRKRSLHWVMVQFLSLCAVLGEQFQRDHWGAALISAQVGLNDAQPETRAWSHGSLSELYLLLLAYNEEGLSISHTEAKEKALEHARRLVSIAGRDSFEVYSTRRQFGRYTSWWGASEFETALEKWKITRERRWSEDDGLTELAEKIAQLMSEDSPDS